MKKYLSPQHIENFLSNISTKQILTAVFLVISVILIAITVFSLMSFSTTHHKLERVTQQYQPKMLSAMQLTTHFYHSLSVLGNYIIDQDNYNHDLYQEKVKDIDSTLNQLTHLSEQFKEFDDQEKLVKIKLLVEKIKKHNKQLLTLATDINSNMPAIGLATNKLEPSSQSMEQIINDLLISAEQNSQTKTIFLIDNLRFTWSMTVSHVRNYLAFRNNSALQDIDLYIEGVKQALTSIEKEKKLLDEEQIDLVDEFHSLFSHYQINLTQVLSIHSGEQWRTDSLIMKKTISPTLRTLTTELENLVLSQQRRIHESNAELSVQIESAESTIKIAIQIATGVTIIVIFLGLKTDHLRTQVENHKSKELLAQYKASHDYLTDIANRSFFLETLTSKINRLDSNHDIALFFLDLDGFKQINDSVGHDAGDFILTETAKRLDNLLRDSDLVARLGGDEFTILLEKPDSIEATCKVAQRAIDAINQGFEFNGQTLQVGCSLGIAFYSDLQKNNTDNRTAAHELLKIADEAMYQAKRNGKNQLHLYKKINETHLREVTNII